MGLGSSALALDTLQGPQLVSSGPPLELHILLTHVHTEVILC